MTKNDCDFDEWFGCLQMNVLDACGVDFMDEDAVRDDYDNGRDMHDVAEEISAEYE